MALSSEILNHKLTEMKASMAEKASREEGRIRSRVLFTGNVHDAVPRRLLLDTRLSPLDKTAWMMIRLHAMSNEGEVFPTYDELQLQLASPGSGKASRETVSRVLTMLRLTGWLSLCQRIRDEKGCVRGNIYALHEEPLSCCDAEKFDPCYLDMVLKIACKTQNKAIRATVFEVLSDIKNEPGLRHYHCHITQFESRMGTAQTPAERQRGECATGSELRESENEPGESETELGESEAELGESETEQGEKTEVRIHDLESELLEKSYSYKEVRKSNYYVRNITHSVNKNTYVLPDSLKSQLRAKDTDMLTQQLQALPETLAAGVLKSLSEMLGRNALRNPVAWMLTVLKRAREGTFNMPDMSRTWKHEPVRPAYHQPVHDGDERQRRREVSSPETVKKLLDKLRANMKLRADIRTVNATRMAALMGG
ncbi:helix-turn-helix domain-containing protein [Escherichia coli]